MLARGMMNVSTLLSKGCRWLVPGLLLAAPAGAETVNLNAGDTIGSSSFDTAGNWLPSAAPSPGNDYFVAILSLRTPPDGASHVFAGDSLTLQSGGGMLFKGTGNTGVITFDPLILDGGLIDHASGFADVFTLDGTVNVPADSTVDARQGPVTILSEISGAGGLTVLSSGGNGYLTTFAGAVMLDGNVMVGPNGALALAETATMTFACGAPGVNQGILGTGTAVFDGTFELDLSAASTVIGDSWVLVDLATLSASFRETFQITGFTEVDGFWTSSAGDYQFDERTGVLTVITGDSDKDGLPDAWEMANFGNLDELPSGDADFDFASNLMEYQAGSDPDDEDSYPDDDSDGLNDGWELAYFFDLDETAEGDPDNDYNSNESEYAAFSDPTSMFSYPDEDSDGINDGWEVFYFEAINLCDPDEDTDGDLYDNEEEFFAETDPTDQISSPDDDDSGAGDGLPDGWEVKWFGMPGESLEVIIAKYAGGDDPDADGYPNSAEYGAGTNPQDEDSHPAALAYWRFEERTEGLVPVGDNSGGNQPNTVLDSSGVGNHMMTWRDYTSPVYQTDLPFPTVPLSGDTNTASLAFTRDGGNLFVTDNIYTSSGVMLNSYVFEEFTIEASFKADALGLWQVVIGKNGNPVGGQPPFAIKLRPDGYLSTGMVDGSGVAREIIGNRPLTAGEWYSVAVTASATELKLWVKAPGDASYVPEGSVVISGAFYDYSGIVAPWVIGLGKWNGADADPFGGSIDEVRIVPEVIESTMFLAAGVVEGDSDGDGLPDEWEMTYFGSLDEVPSADFDGDLTSNRAEFLLGLIPSDPSSRFAATISAAHEIGFPAADGLTFVIERSENLAAWEEVGTVTADGSAGTWTDPEPLDGKAFYRVTLSE